MAVTFNVLSELLIAELLFRQVIDILAGYYFCWSLFINFTVNAEIERNDL